MSISDKLTRLVNARNAIVEALTEKGVDATGHGYEDFAHDIAAIQAGGSMSADGAVRFFDYDGTVLHTYTAEEFAELTQMPGNPEHEGLTAQGWNWTLADAKAKVQSSGKCEIGQMYIPTDGATRLHIELTEGRTAPYLGLSPNGTVTIDWGDGSETDTLTGTSLTSSKSIQHTYAEPGEYVVSIYAESGTYAFPGQSAGTNLFKKVSGSPGNESLIYENCVKKIHIGRGVTNFGSYAFLNCYSMKYITIPNTVTNIETDAFQKCRGLEIVIIPTSVTAINARVFQNCYSLEHVILPNGIQTIGANAFQNCYAFSSIVLPDSVTSIGTYVFGACNSLEKVHMSNGATSIGTYAFQNNFALMKLDLPAGLTELSTNVLQTCYSISALTIPEGLTSIKASAMINCSGLAELHVLPTEPPTVENTNAFSGIQSDCKIYVPAESLEAYKTATNWSGQASKMVGV